MLWDNVRRPSPKAVATTKTISGGLMNIAPASALAIWALGTIWLLLFFFLEHFDPVAGEGLIDWIQAATILPLAALFPFFRKWFVGWLAKAKS